MSKEKVTFEEAFSRLEVILEAMNKEKVSLDDSLKLFEEANGLINLCSKQLLDAESKIEILIKGRNGEIALDKEGKAIMEKFTPQKETSPIREEEIPF